MLLLSSADFFQIYLFQTILSDTLSECQTVWISKGYQQQQKLEKVNETPELNTA